MDDLRFEELRFQIDPQSRADSNALVFDTVTLEVAGTEDDCSAKILIVAGGAQPPPAGVSTT